MSSFEKYIVTPYTETKEWVRDEFIYVSDYLFRLTSWISVELDEINKKVDGIINNPTTGNHDNLTNVTPDQHHNQAHEFYGADHLNIPTTFPPSKHTHNADEIINAPWLTELQVREIIDALAGNFSSTYENEDPVDALLVDGDIWLENDLTAPTLLTNIPNFTFPVGSYIEYNVALHFSGGDSYTLQGAPAWLTISGDLMLGTPDAELVTNGITVTATNAVDAAVSNLFRVDAYSHNLDPPTCDNLLPDLVADEAVEMTHYDVSVHFQHTDYYSLQGAPGGIYITSLGVIRGAPVTAGGFVCTVTGHGHGTVVSNNFNITVSGYTPVPPVFTGTIPDQSIVVNIAMTLYDASAHFSNSPTGYALQNAPIWMSIDNIGQITGTPDAVAITNGITVTASNANGSDMSNAFAFDAEAVPLNPPVFTGTIPDFNEEFTP